VPTADRTRLAHPPDRAHAREVHDHARDDAHRHDDHGHSHGLVHQSIKRSREGIRAVLISLGVLGLAAVAQRSSSRCPARSRCWPT
jgi:hypothetical protein